LSRPLLDLLPDPPPCLALGCFPSPVEDHPALARLVGAASLTVKRDDLNGREFGGNKLRAIEFLLPVSPPGIVTMGGYGSTWCAALARLGAGAGRRVHAALFPQPWTAAVEGALLTTLRHGEVHQARARWRLPAAIHRAWRAAGRAGSVSWMPAGGADPVGVLGSINAAIEFSRQIDAGMATLPDAVVVPLGSGGTTAGLLLGFWLARRAIEVCAVRVTDPWFANRHSVLSLVARTKRLLRRHGLAVVPGRASLRIVKDQLGGGYGHATPAGVRARQLMSRAGLVLDATYGAKAAAALASLAPSFPRLCFWHTFDTRLVSGPPFEHPLLREARVHAESLWPHPMSI
jgi:1-aminocyclopropane-1-carboxylate deaminase/D-cysteine desulfhydrase-like pyridoxal-dependent ACC family enzyme